MGLVVDPGKSGGVDRRGAGPFLRPGGSSPPPDRDPCRLEFLLQHQERLACRLDLEAPTFTAGTFNGVEQGLYTRQTGGDDFGLHKHLRRPIVEPNFLRCCNQKIRIPYPGVRMGVRSNAEQHDLGGTEARRDSQNRRPSMRPSDAAELLENIVARSVGRLKSTARSAGQVTLLGEYGSPVGEHQFREGADRDAVVAVEHCPFSIGRGFVVL
jgi:hypothetical protein